MLQERKEVLKNRIHNAVVSDVLRRRLLFCILNAALSLTALVMTVVNYFTKEYVLLYSTLIFSVLCLLNILAILYSDVKKNAIYRIFGAEALVLLAFFFISGVPDGFSALWVSLIPSFALLIFGMKSGSIFSSISLLMLVFLFWIPVGKGLLLYSYSETFMLRFPFLYCSIFLISLLTEWIRRETQHELEKARNEYYDLYRHDSLTGLRNRFGIKEYMEAAFGEKEKERAAIIIMDIDDFKKINDTYGHEAGDQVLKMVASIPEKNMCEHSHFCRWGGEEFLLLMQCDHDPESIAENIRREIESTPVVYYGKVIYVTVSLGVSVRDCMSDMTIHDVIDQADQAMYCSKHSGKNRVTVYGTDSQKTKGCPS